MEDAAAIKDQSSASGNSATKLLRYPLRSATKSKEEKTPVANSTNSSAAKRGRPPSSVSKSMGVLDLSAKVKSPKPTRRLSIPAKSTPSPAPKPVAGNVTPISEARAKRSANNQGRSHTPLSDISRSSNRKKFNIISSASYWISQIKLSESADNHSISLAFFKLALEAGCEPLQRMREELKSYARRHDLAELGEPAKELFERYNMGSFEQMQVSETISRAPEEGTQSSDDDLHSSSTTIGTEKLKPKSLNTSDTSQVKGSVKEVTKKIIPAPMARTYARKNSANSKSASEIVGHNAQKKYQKPSKQDSTMEKYKVKKEEKKSAPEEGPTNSSVVGEPTEQNKENMMEELSLQESQ